jgi:23S rRNA (uracil1939-C5)-methyltransferase
MIAPSEPGARQKAIEEATNERVSCEHADRCAGCPMIALPHSDQLALKRQRVAASRMRYPALQVVETEPLLPAHPTVGYRTRAKLIVGRGGTLGLFEKGGGHHVVDIPGCRVLAPALARVAAYLRLRIAESDRCGGPLAPFEPGGPGVLRAVDLRETLGKDGAHVLVTLVVQGSRPIDSSALARVAHDLMEALPEVVGVGANFHARDTPQVLGAQTITLAGESSSPDWIGASFQLATFGSFVQAHRGQAERVHRILADAVASVPPGRCAPRVLDLYGGSGAIALALAASGAHVRLVESFAPAAARAGRAALEQALDLDAQCSDVATALRALCEHDERFDAAVVNPPRRGMSPRAREWLARLAPSLIGYVSCDPETLARDLDHFSRLGYATTTLRPLDMIPLTDEVETVALLRPSAVPVARVVHQNDEVVIVDKCPHEPTVPQGEYASSLLARTRRLTGADASVPVNRLDVGTSGLVAFARAARHLAKWERALQAPASRAIYVAAVRGVTPSKGSVTRTVSEGLSHVVMHTRYRRLAIASGHSILQVVPDRGHGQHIRRHLASIGHPVIGDARFGHEPTNRHFEEKHTLDRTFLHCVRLEIAVPVASDADRAGPVGNGTLVARAVLPGDLRTVLERIATPSTMRLLEDGDALRGGPT